jgi:hypothetical protein
MVNGFVKVLKIIFTAAFSAACGLFLVRFSIPVYFKLFSPVPKTLNNFYIAIGVFVLLIILLDIVFFKRERYNWGIGVSVTAVLLLVFGIPIFLLENNNMLWQEAVLSRSGPVYFIDFSDDTLAALKYFRNLFTLIWGEAYLYVYTGITIYLIGFISLWKLDWRIRGVSI